MTKPRQNDSQVPPVQVDSASLRKLRQFSRLLKRLPRDCSTTLGAQQRSAAQAEQRTLTYATYAGLVLVATLNSGIRSLRDIQRASELKRVRRALTPPGAETARRTSMGSLSESVRVFDPELLQPLIAKLARRLPRHASPDRVSPEEIPLELLRKVVAVDGSCLQGLSHIIQAATRGTSSRKESGKSTWRMHMQFRPMTKLPDPVHPSVLTPDRTTPDDDERAVLARHLEPECVYVGDRGFEKYTLFNQIVESGSDYVIRVQMRSLQVLEHRPLPPSAQSAGVVEDQIVSANRSHPSDPQLTHPVRRVVIQIPTASRKSQDATEETLVLLTSLVDVPAEVVGAVYRLRWMIETFFRFFKHVLGLKRLFSTHSEGVQIQIAVAIIAALLMALAGGRSLGRTGTFAIEMFLQGLASEKETLALLKRDQEEQARRQKS
jgi:hypothetical protein